MAGYILVMQRCWETPEHAKHLVFSQGWNVICAIVRQTSLFAPSCAEPPLLCQIGAILRRSARLEPRDTTAIVPLALG